MKKIKKPKTTLVVKMKLQRKIFVDDTIDFCKFIGEIIKEKVMEKLTNCHRRIKKVKAPIEIIVKIKTAKL